MSVLVHVHVFFYENTMYLKWIFVIHYDPRLRHVFDDAVLKTQKTNGKKVETGIREHPRN